MVYETRTRSLVKAVSWRFAGSLATGLIVYAFTRKLEIALGIGALEALSKIFIFFFHERMWSLIPFGKKEAPVAVVWLTGLSGAGKTTIANALERELKARGRRVQCLDGDVMRKLLPNTGFSKEERDAHINRVGVLASILEANGIVVVASFISPYRESRDFVRSLCKAFIEVHVSTPLELCEARDVKRLYAKARRGELKEFTGVSSPYEPPIDPEVRIDTTHTTVEEAVQILVDRLGRLSRAPNTSLARRLYSKPAPAGTLYTPAP